MNDPSPRPDRPRARRSRTAASPGQRKGPVLVLAGVAVVGLALAAVYLFVLRDARRHHAFPVQWPAEAPSGEPVPLAWGVKAGDVFVTTVRYQSGLLMSVKPLDPMSGMSLNGQYRIARAYEARDGGLAATAVVYFDLCDGSLPILRERAWSVLGDSADRYVVTTWLDASGRKVGGPPPPRGAGLRRSVLDLLSCGLGDLEARFVPDRPIRLGEAWDLSEGCDVSGVVPGVRLVAATDREGVTWPAPSFRGRVGAEAIEEKDGERCVRLRLAVYVSMEGETTVGDREGWVTTAARVHGPVWVSLATGLPWAWDWTADFLSSHIVGDRSEERQVRQLVTATTKRAERLPP